MSLHVHFKGPVHGSCDVRHAVDIDISRKLSTRCVLWGGFCKNMRYMCIKSCSVHKFLIFYASVSREGKGQHNLRIWRYPPTSLPPDIHACFTFFNMSEAAV